VNDLVYESLADALNGLPNGFPRTASKVEIGILKKLFSPEEAFLAGQLSRTRETAEAIASRTGLAPQETGALLQKMADRGLIWDFDEGGRHVFRLAPFIVGIYESTDIDHELAHLI